jgi:predicted DNA-binding protein with PD1-like motif
MRAIRNGAYWQLKVEPGEEIIAALTEFLRRQRVRSAALIGIGAAENVVLGCFIPKTRKYRKRTLRGDNEIAALVGNTAWRDGAPACHIHAVVATPGLVTRAGHLFAATVTVTCEISLWPGPRRLERKVDPACGLALLDLPLP